MHARELVQLAAVVADKASLLIHSREPFPEVATERYWTACRCRQDGWSRALKEFVSRKQDQSAPSADDGDSMQPLLEEVLTAEVLCRVWAAICSLADAQRGVEEAGPLALNVLFGHLETRHRVLSLMVYGYGLGVEQSVTLNRLRIRNERWTDTLLSLLGPRACRAEWAFEPCRVLRQANVLARQQTAYGVNPTKSLLLATIAGAYPSHPCPCPLHAELNRRIACSIIACFPPQAFDSCGQLTSVQQLWLGRTQPETQGRLDVAKPRGPA